MGEVEIGLGGKWEWVENEREDRKKTKWERNNWLFLWACEIFLNASFHFHSFLFKFSFSVSFSSFVWQKYFISNTGEYELFSPSIRTSP